MKAKKWNRLDNSPKGNKKIILENIAIDITDDELNAKRLKCLYNGLSFNVEIDKLRRQNRLHFKKNRLQKILEKEFVGKGAKSNFFSVPFVPNYQYFTNNDIKPIN